MCLLGSLHQRWEVGGAARFLESIAVPGWTVLLALYLRWLTTVSLIEEHGCVPWHRLGPSIASHNLLLPLLNLLTARHLVHILFN